jgi:hypothetical protein
VDDMGAADVLRIRAARSHRIEREIIVVDVNVRVGRVGGRVDEMCGAKKPEERDRCVI